jgi:hypothetical protein
MTEKRYINEKLISEITGFALATLRNDRATNRRIPYIKVGSAVRYSLEDVVAFMESHKIQQQQGKKANPAPGVNRRRD